MNRPLAARIVATVLGAVLAVAPFCADAGATGKGKPSGEASIRLLKDREYVRDLIRAIDGAQEEIVVCMFLFKASGYPGSYADRVVERLLKAARRGVRVEVVLERGGDPTGTLDRDNEATRRRLEEGGVRTRTDSPRRTTHTKLVVIDRRTTFVGSHNLTHSALKMNHEMSVAIDSPAVAAETLQYIRTSVLKD
ncbi:MAG TPA: phospholipase D-like domain-containing protein [Syntrophales bacterium]|nr:phospholipase D-like domain-containing protein [Syntrophales bacterium]